MAIDALQGYLIDQLRTAFGLPDVKVAAADLAEDATRMYEGIAADPPDPNFAQVTVLGPVTTVVPSESGPLDRASATLANAFSVDAVLAEGLLHAIERYQGADIAGDAAWARQHLRQAREFATLLGDHQSATNDAILALRSVIVADINNIDVAAQAFELNRARVFADGFSPAELGLFTSRGMSGADISALDARYGAFTPSTSAGTARDDPRRPRCGDGQQLGMGDLALRVRRRARLVGSGPGRTTPTPVGDRSLTLAGHTRQASAARSRSTAPPRQICSARSCRRHGTSISTEPSTMHRTDAERHRVPGPTTRSSGCRWSTTTATLPSTTPGSPSTAPTCRLSSAP